MEAIILVAATSITVKVIAAVMTAVLIALQAASLLEKLFALIVRLLDRYTTVVEAFDKVGVAWQRLHNAWVNALERWRKPPGGAGTADA